MKVSISLTERQLEFIDEKVERGVYASRSAAMAAAIRRLQERDLVREYAEEYEGLRASGEIEMWDSTLMDGLADESSWWQ